MSGVSTISGCDFQICRLGISPELLICHRHPLSVYFRDASVCYVQDRTQCLLFRAPLSSFKSLPIFSNTIYPAFKPLEPRSVSDGSPFLQSWYLLTKSFDANLKVCESIWLFNPTINNLVLTFISSHLDKDNSFLHGLCMSIFLSVSAPCK